MTDKNKKTIMLNTLILCFCIIVVALFCFIPNKNLNNEVVDIYTISFDSDGGSSIAAIEIKDGTDFEMPKTPTKEGYIFIGWMLGDELYDFSTPLDKDITLTAGWKKIDEDKKYYVVTFNTDGGTTIANQILEENTRPTRPENPTKEGFEFVEWQVNGIAYNFDTPVTSDITITAVYKQNEETPPQDPGDQTPTYRVTFNLNGGVAGGNCNAQNVKEGSQPRNSCNPTRANHTFAGWDKNINTQIRENTTFTARWNENTKFTIRFQDANGNYICGAQTYYSGENVNLNQKCGAPGISHKNFAGWRMGGQNYTNYTVRESVTFTATYSNKSYSFSVQKQGDGTTDAGYKLFFDGLDGTPASIQVCNNSGRCYNNVIKADGYSVNKNTFIEEFGSCTIKFTNDNQTYTCYRR